MLKGRGWNFFNSVAERSQSRKTKTNNPFTKVSLNFSKDLTKLAILAHRTETPHQKGTLLL